ncbi:hypothetical protein CYG49_01000 [Candidatus Saccharibacteria bacterium]|nr:MAG: hypothetical protein CYG49_01000 [Candidatus Saccharibacteria bacterium]
MIKKTIKHIQTKINKTSDSVKDSQAQGAQRAMLEELFNDYYLQRSKVYKMNFFRGIFFGLGSVLGGTVVVAIVISIISLFVNFPLIGELLQNTQNSLEQSQ